MHPTSTSNGHRQLDEPVITTRAEVARQVREEVDRALDAAHHPARAGRAIANIGTIAAIVWLVLAMVAGLLGGIPLG